MDFKDPESPDYFGFEKTDQIEVNGSIEIGFRWSARSHGFCAELNDIWFEDSSLKEFAANLQMIVEESVQELRLDAMSDFTLTVGKADKLGHFNVTVEMSSPLKGNFARIVIGIEAEGVLVLAKNLLESIQ
ncbi:MAG: hypothetical protein HRU09_14515 [Oligoflexales bacterium]|nr:hypothetical protein [Oligoflexales bacterium]